jgi:hypothetical protein
MNKQDKKIKDIVSKSIKDKSPSFEEVEKSFELSEKDKKEEAVRQVSFKKPRPFNKVAVLSASVGLVLVIIIVAASNNWWKGGFTEDLGFTNPGTYLYSQSSGFLSEYVSSSSKFIVSSSSSGQEDFRAVKGEKVFYCSFENSALSDFSFTDLTFSSEKGVYLGEADYQEKSYDVSLEAADKNNVTFFLASEGENGRATFNFSLDQQK